MKILMLESRQGINGKKLLLRGQTYSIGEDVEPNDAIILTRTGHAVRVPAAGEPFMVSP